MKPVQRIHGVAVGLEMGNVDTDQIVPARYLYRNRSDGFADTLFRDMRFDPQGREDGSFPLNGPEADQATILVTLDNFGCGSSREHAPWALLDFGVRCVISTSFADIFYNNCFKNGILPIVVSQEELDKLMDDAERGANATISVDLEAQEIKGPDGGTISFEIDAFKKHCLLNGLDDIGLTMEKAASIDTFESKVNAERPWV